jgi:hypothetical protein
VDLKIFKIECVERDEESLWPLSDLQRLMLPFCLSLETHPKTSRHLLSVQFVDKEEVAK